VSVVLPPGIDGQALHAEFSTNLQTQPADNAACSLARSPKRHSITTSQTCAKFNQPLTVSLSSQTQSLHQINSHSSAPDFLPIVSIKQVVPDTFISGTSVLAWPTSPNNRQISLSRKKYEISPKLDSEDTMKASDSATVINLSQ
jgi:hypothetical protein